MRRATGQVLRRGDRVHARQTGHPREDESQRVLHPLAHRRVRGAERGGIVFPDAGEIRALREEGRGHRPGFIQVEIDADAVVARPFHQGLKVGQALFVVDAKLGERRAAGREVAQDGVQPDAIDARRGEPLQQSIGIRIQPGVQQRVAIDGDVGIDQAQGVRLGGRRFPRRGALGSGKLPDEVEAGLGRAPDFRAKIRLDHAADFGGAAPGGFVRRLVAERRAPGFQLAQLDPQEVLLAQHERQAFGRQLQQLQQLLIRQEMPIPAQQGDIPSLAERAGHLGGRGQAHGRGQRGDVPFRGSDDLCQPGRLDGLPVAPDELVEAVGEMAADKGGWRVAGGQ